MVGETLADRWKLEELVGTGGMSTVYRARDLALERNVALKLLHERYSDTDEHVERFRREARMVASLQHQNVVTIIDRGDHEGRQFIVFEFVDGENLKQLVEREGPLPVERALELAIQVARGLAYAHQNGVVHRDVKPQNVILNGHGQAKVTDFGIARSLDVQHQGMTQTGTVLGTSNYIAPEQAQGRPVGEHTDVYSLGVVLYELLAGEVPFTGDNFVAVAMRHINEPPPSVRIRRPDVSLRLDSAIARSLAKNPDERFATMAEFGAELQACLQEARAGEPGWDTVVLPPRGRQPRTTQPRRRRRFPLAILVVLLGLAALAAVVAIVLLRENDGDGGGGGGGGGAATGSPVALTGVRGWDPNGTGGEHDADAPKAADGNPSTAWSTEHYQATLAALGKPGVGLLLQAASPADVRKLTVTSDTPGFVARIQAGDNADGPFRDVSGEQTVGDRTTFDLHDAKARYFVVWITQLPPGLQADVNEVTASS